MAISLNMNIPLNICSNSPWNKINVLRSSLGRGRLLLQLSQSWGEGSDVIKCSENMLSLQLAGAPQSDWFFLCIALIKGLCFSRSLVFLAYNVTCLSEHFVFSRKLTCKAPASTYTAWRYFFSYKCGGNLKIYMGMKHPGPNEIHFDVSIWPIKVPSKHLKGQNTVSPNSFSKVSDQLCQNTFRFKKYFKIDISWLQKSPQAKAGYTQTIYSSQTLFLFQKLLQETMYLTELNDTVTEKYIFIIIMFIF